MLRRLIYNLALGLVVLGLFLTAHAATAATLRVTPREQTVGIGETFVVEVRLGSAPEVINAVQGQISYTPGVLAVTDISRGGSFLTLWVTEPKDAPQGGTISFVGGVPNGSLVADGLVLRVTFQAKAQGPATIGFDQAATSVLLNDGKGSKTSVEFVTGSYTVTGASSFTVPITSPTQPNENKWYRDDTVEMRWQPEGNHFYSHTLNAGKPVLPDDVPDEPAGAATYHDVPEGISYFTLSEKDPTSQWQVVGQRRVQIDQTPPLAFEPMIARDTTAFGGKYVLIFSTFDAVSGIDHFEVEEGSQLTEQAASPYVLQDQARQGRIVVRAYDQAGNAVETVAQEARNLRQQPVRVRVGAIILIAILVLGVLFIFVQRRLRRSKQP